MTDSVLGSKEKPPTDYDTEVGRDHVQHRHVRYVRHDAADAGQDGCEADNRVQGGNGLREIGWRDALANQEPCGSSAPGP